MSERDRNYNFSAGISVKTLTPSRCLSLSPACLLCGEGRLSWCFDRLVRAAVPAVSQLCSRSQLTPHCQQIQAKNLNAAPHTHWTLVLFSCLSPPRGLCSLYQFCNFLICLLLLLSHCSVSQNLFHIYHALSFYLSVWDVHFHHLRWNRYDYQSIYLSIYSPKKTKIM